MDLPQLCPSFFLLPLLSGTPKAFRGIWTRPRVLQPHLKLDFRKNFQGKWGEGGSGTNWGKVICKRDSCTFVLGPPKCTHKLHLPEGPPYALSTPLLH